MYRLLVIGALLWASSVSSSPVQQFHPIAETLVGLAPDTEHTRFPHEESCRYFYLVLSAGDVSLKACPEDKLFDFVKHRCVEKEEANCWVRHLVEDMDSDHVHLRVRDGSKCPQPFGKFPDVTDCAHYVQCLAGRATTKKCAPYEYFDKIKRKCIAEINAVCADETDIVEPGYKCPRSLGSFSFPGDCSKYYECIGKRPDLRTCQKHMLFDEKKRECVPHKKALCGSRPDPYDEHTTLLQSTIGELSEATTEVRPKAFSPTVTEMPINSGTSKTNNLKQFSTSPPKQVSDITISPDSLENDPSNNIEEFFKESEESKESSDESREENVENLNENFPEDVLAGKTDEPITTKDVTVNSKTTHDKMLSEESTTESSRTEILSSAEMTDCLPGDLTCFRGQDGRVFRCPSPNGFFSHPTDENALFHCSNKIIHIKRCPSGLIFLQSKAACTWPVDKFQKA